MRVFSPSLSATCAAVVLALGTILVSPQIHASEANSAAPITTAERDFLSQIGLEKMHRVEYRDVKGAPLTFAQFQKLLPVFQSFGMKKTKGDLATAVISLQAADTKEPAPRSTLKPGSAFPAFKLPATDDTIVDNASLLGKYTLINFYFAECAPCIKEVPMLNAFAAKHKDMTVLALTFDSVKETNAFAKQTKFGWRTVADARKLIDEVGIKHYPAFALLDPKGILIAIGREADFAREDGLENWVTKKGGSEGYLASAPIGGSLDETSLSRCRTGLFSSLLGWRTSARSI